MFAELHCHSAYSFLDGASLPEELVATAARLGHRALALTDHNGVFGSMEHEQAARALGLTRTDQTRVATKTGISRSVLVW